MLRLGGCQIAHSSSKAYETCTTSRHWMMTVLSIEHLLLILCRIRGGGRLCVRACPPWGLPCRMELTLTLELAAQPWPRQLRQALMTLNPDSNLDRI